MIPSSFLDKKIYKGDIFSLFKGKVAASSLLHAHTPTGGYLLMRGIFSDCGIRFEFCGQLLLGLETKNLRSPSYQLFSGNDRIFRCFPNFQLPQTPKILGCGPPTSCRKNSKWLPKNALSLALKQRHGPTRNWPVDLLLNQQSH